MRAIAQGGRMRSLGLRDTLITKSYDGQRLDNIVAQIGGPQRSVANAAAQMNARFPESATMNSLYVRNGIRTRAEIFEYQKALSTNAYAFYEVRALRDAHLLGVPMSRSIH